ncbi:MAG: DegT/DnrJ/EryC1/StrS family aminotransferase [Candidatus Shapirobacteria bacterium]|jgi:glycine/serine hydroxymethyltransferase|nr:DegT/DnrJ/EryC1/StrS family aminotransferase [Candidatus Shapirobacteria bacterium]
MALIEAKTLLSGVKKQEKLNANLLHLTANENQLSRTANNFLASKLSERYYFGAGKEGVIDFGSYTFVGMSAVEQLVDRAELALKEMTGAAIVNLSCFSGLHAMMCAILSTTKPGDLIMSIAFEDGGHGATKGIIESLGRKHAFAKFDQKKLQFNVTETAKIFKQTRAKALYIDISVHLNSLNVQKIRQALGKNALIIFDASHSMGLILGGQFPSPFQEGTDVICGNTHKTFAGPQRGMILFKDKTLGEKADWLIKTTFTSSVHTSELIALAISILEYYKFGKKYAIQIINNSMALAKAFVELGYEVRISSNGKYSNNEQVHVFVDKLGDRIKLYHRLVNNNISTNFMQILGGRSFARIGTQEITRRGMKEKDMSIIADLFHRAILGKPVKTEVVKFNALFKKIYYSFDQ